MSNPFLKKFAHTTTLLPPRATSVRSSTACSHSQSHLEHTTTRDRRWLMITLLTSLAEGKFNHDFRMAFAYKFSRHPLQEQIVDTFVPNDLLLAGRAREKVPSMEEDDDGEDDTMTSRRDARSMLVCTGANACGKVS